MLDNVLDTTEVAATAISGTVSDWATQATANLAACGVITEGEAFSEPLTRADAAEMLVRALEVLAERPGLKPHKKVHRCGAPFIFALRGMPA